MTVLSKQALSLLVLSAAGAGVVVAVALGVRHTYLNEVKTETKALAQKTEDELKASMTVELRKTEERLRIEMEERIGREFKARELALTEKQNAILKDGVTLHELVKREALLASLHNYGARAQAEAAKKLAGEAKGSADEAKGSAGEAKGSAGDAHASADEARKAADIAVNAAGQAQASAKKAGNSAAVVNALLGAPDSGTPPQRPRPPATYVDNH